MAATKKAHPLVQIGIQKHRGWELYVVEIPGHGVYYEDSLKSAFTRAASALKGGAYGERRRPRRATTRTR
jgi:hypothetical protein